MEAKPLSKTIYNRAKKEGVEQIVLQFSGGSDEGYLNIELLGEGLESLRYDEKARDFAQEIEDWAWEVYSYSGAGDGSNYGDNITYDIKNNQVHTDEWYDAPNYTNYPATKLELQ